jgi:hypothetical protein
MEENMIPFGVLGRFNAGREKGRFAEVLDDRQVSGGFLLMTYASADRSGPAYDTWYENMDSVAALLEGDGWSTDWGQ